MPKYKIKGTDILHNKKLYPEGTAIDLTKEQAQVLADYLEVIEEIQKNPKPAQKKPNTTQKTEKQTNTINEPEGGES